MAVYVSINILLRDVFLCEWLIDYSPFVIEQ